MRIIENIYVYGLASVGNVRKCSVHHVIAACLQLQEGAAELEWPLSRMTCPPFAQPSAMPIPTSIPRKNARKGDGSLSLRKLYARCCLQRFASFFQRCCCRTCVIREVTRTGAARKCYKGVRQEACDYASGSDEAGATHLNHVFRAC